MLQKRAISNKLLELAKEAQQIDPLKDCTIADGALTVITEPIMIVSDSFSPLQLRDSGGIAPHFP
jgi:hypothetical protein